MRLISTTEARKRLGQLLEAVEGGENVGLGRRGQIEAVMIKYPRYLNNEVDSWTQLAANGGAFDFWADEPELYTRQDIKQHYA